MKIKKKTLKIIIVLIIVGLISFVIYHYTSYFKEKSYTQEEGLSYYSKNRGKPEFEISLIQVNESYDVFKLNYKSRSFMANPAKVFGLLFMPHKNNVPGLVLLPGGGVSKEAGSKLASDIAAWGYAVLTIDTRGIGETGGYYLSLEQDYHVYTKGEEPTQYLSIYDALRGFDVLKEIKNIDHSNIAIVGESMGGRVGVIAASLDSSVKGFVGISTAGYHVRDEGRAFDKFLISIDPDSYIGKISPRPVYMLHGLNDSSVPIESARFTFELANEPKRFFSADGCWHGYCDNMEDELKKDLIELFQSSR